MSLECWEIWSMLLGLVLVHVILWWFHTVLEMTKGYGYDYGVAQDGGTWATHSIWSDEKAAEDLRIEEFITGEGEELEEVEKDGAKEDRIHCKRCSEGSCRGCEGGNSQK